MASPIAIGVEANAPNELVPGIAKRQATFSRATVRASIGVRVVARVLARSWLCAGQPSAFAAHSGGAFPTPFCAGAAFGRTPVSVSAASANVAIRVRTRSPLAEPRRARQIRAPR